MSKILIIDDSPPIITLIQEMVTLIGHSADTALGGYEGLERLRETDPDLVLLDLMMPDLNGWQVYDEARTFSTVPIIFITASDTASNRQKAAELGATLLSKEINIMQLKKQIEETISTHP